MLSMKEIFAPPFLAFTGRNNIESFYYAIVNPLTSVLSRGSILISQYSDKMCLYFDMSAKFQIEA